MLYKHGRLEKKLHEHGRPATAEILAIRTEGSGNSAAAMWSNDDDLTTTWFLCRLELRVTPPGEPPFEVTVRTRLNTLKSAGDTVPVLYDPDDHDKVLVDYELDAKTEMDALAQMRQHTSPVAAAGVAPLDPELQELIDLEEQERTSGAASAVPAQAPAADPAQARLDQLRQLGELHTQGVLTDAEFAAEKAKILTEGS